MNPRRCAGVILAGVVLVLGAGCGVRTDAKPVPIPTQDVPNLTSTPTPSGSN